MVGSKYVLRDPELTEAVDIVGQRAPLEREGASEKGGEEDHGDGEEKETVIGRSAWVGRHVR